MHMYTLYTPTHVYIYIYICVGIFLQRITGHLQYAAIVNWPIKSSSENDMRPSLDLFVFPQCFGAALLIYGSSIHVSTTRHCNTAVA